MNLFRRKSVTELQNEALTDHSLKRALGALNLTMLGIGAIIGTGHLRTDRDRRGPETPGRRSCSRSRSRASPRSSRPSATPSLRPSSDGG